NDMYYDKKNDAGDTGTANDRPRNRYRFRLRWGFDKDYGDDWKVGFRLATGSTTNPNSENQTLGNPGYFTEKTINVDRAYAMYEPNGLKDYGILKGLKIAAGKFDNPFLRYSTIIVWDPDVMPEGAYEQANWKIYGDEQNSFNIQTTLGQFITNENAGASTDSEMYSYQNVFMLSTYAFNQDKPTDVNFAVTYYDYPGYFNTVANNTVAVSFLRNNSTIADNFRVVDLYPELQFDVNGMPTTLFYNYVVNTANVGTTNAQAGGNDIHDSNTAWGLGGKIGHAKKKGSWEAFYGYYNIGVNAVADAFDDDDFGGPGYNGFSNRKGHKFGFSYMMTDSLALNWTAYVVAPLHPIASSSVLGLGSASNESIFRSYLDLMYKF
ncbi:MAG: putative porin, partial [Candidatus Saccharimonadales bacterium]